MTAALFAANRGLKVVQVSQDSPLVYHSGLLDFCYRKTSDSVTPKSPRAAIAELIKRESKHPYANIDEGEIDQSIKEILLFLNERGLDYRGDIDAQVSILTSLGTLKPSCVVPAKMWEGANALKKGKKGLVFDIHGLRGFSAKQITEVVKPRWNNLECARIQFPGLEKRQEAIPEQMARALDNPLNLDAFIDVLRPHISNQEIIGFPAILGIARTRHITSKIEEALGVTVFEIPTVPVSIPGIRLKEAFERGLLELGVKRYSNVKLETLMRDSCGNYCGDLNYGTSGYRINAKNLLVATGRFLGKGLNITRDRISETLLDLPVTQPEFRHQYYHTGFFNKEGHPINKAGIETDEYFRPLKLGSEPKFQNLFYTGTILAHQDWKKEKSGSGIAISSAFKAVSAVDQMFNESRFKLDKKLKAV